MRWKRIWKLPCPGKIRHFVWRIAHNTLATKDILGRRGMDIEDHKCFMCNSRHESGKHLFVYCNEVKLLWRRLDLEHVRQQLSDCASIGETLDLLWQLSGKERLQVTVMWWQWWNQRNKVREGENPMDLDQFAFRAACMAAEYQGCFCKSPKPSGNPQC